MCISIPGGYHRIAYGESEIFACVRGDSLLRYRDFTFVISHGSRMRTYFVHELQHTRLMSKSGLLVTSSVHCHKNHACSHQIQQNNQIAGKQPGGAKKTRGAPGQDGRVRLSDARKTTAVAITASSLGRHRRQNAGAGRVGCTAITYSSSAAAASRNPPIRRPRRGAEVKRK